MLAQQPPLQPAIPFATQRACACGFSVGDSKLALALALYLHRSGVVAEAEKVLTAMQSAPSTHDMGLDKQLCSGCHLAPDMCCWMVRTDGCAQCREYVEQSSSIQKLLCCLQLPLRRTISKDQSLFCDECQPDGSVMHRMIPVAEIGALRHFLEGCALLKVWDSIAL